ncbi:hypothetical protein [Desulfopila sp. IMCC35008]|uniref:hypothetical protein n=1 Tax=Desulfopila sp. IMCC35008 TaxID=2653858 RepID=UPI0013D6FA2C|nr:hypothetical protein [Desulfopila sp. IMCC35008]
MKQVLGRFEVVDKNRLSRSVTVSQESFIDVNGVVVNHRKIYTIGDQDGEELVPAEDPTIYLQQDGSWLKKVGPIETGNL